MSVTCGNGMAKVGFGRSKSNDSKDITGVRWLWVGRDRHSLQRPRTKMGKKGEKWEKYKKGEEKGREEKREQEMKALGFELNGPRTCSN